MFKPEFEDVEYDRGKYMLKLLGLTVSPDLHLRRGGGGSGERGLGRNCGTWGCSCIGGVGRWAVRLGTYIPCSMGVLRVLACRSVSMTVACHAPQVGDARFICRNTPRT